MSRRLALVRRPGPLLAGGIVTHIARQPVDVDRAAAEHAGYVQALEGAGWTVHPVEPADDAPDAVFVEDTVVVVEDLAVLTRPGAPSRRAEVAGTAAAVAALGLRTATIEAPGTLEGGDVLQVGSTVYVGRGDRTNDAGIAQLAQLLAPLGRAVRAVGLREVLHLKSAMTALPDGALIGLPHLLDVAGLPQLKVPPEEEGAHVVPLGAGSVLVSASAPRTVTWLSELGLEPVVVEIGEFEKLEGCVTCLSVLIP